MARSPVNPHPVAFPVSVGVHSHVGKVRSENQDRISRFATPLGDFLVVADGIGGHRGGAEASRMVTEGYARHLAVASPDADPLDALKVASHQVSAEIYAAGHSGDAQLQNMGSTVAFVLLRGDTAFIGHVGDSRVYHIRGSQMYRITRDHSAVQNLLDHGLITESQAQDHPDASVLTRSFGQKPDVELDYDTVTLLPGDALLLCTDGLWGYVNEQEMEAIASSASLSPQACADALLELALRAGGADNISLEYVRLGVPPIPTDSTVGIKKAIPRGTLIAIGVVALLLGIGLAIWLVPHFLQSQRGSGKTAAKPAPAPATPPPTSPPPSGQPPTTTQTPAPASPASPKPPSQPVPPERGALVPRIGVLGKKSWKPPAHPWFRDVSSWSYGDVRIIDDAAGTCGAHARAKPAVYYDRGHKDAAFAIRPIIPDASVDEMPDGMKGACGDFDVIVIPSKSEIATP